mmetsp:Transcript_52333/g.67112  ORF Transcript_52333/g.67112 Transcript_52333/m.67112 type:complete len:376 (-) Transcript_52333:127-1254(-)
MFGYYFGVLLLLQRTNETSIKKCQANKNRISQKKVLINKKKTNSIKKNHKTSWTNESKLLPLNRGNAPHVRSSSLSNSQPHHYINDDRQRSASTSRGLSRTSSLTSKMFGSSSPSKRATSMSRLTTNHNNQSPTDVSPLIFHQTNEHDEEDKEDDITVRMEDFAGNWKQLGPCDNIDRFLTILNKPWPMRKVVEALRLKQKVECVYPEEIGEENNQLSLRFIVYKPGSPAIVVETPGKECKTTHGMLGFDMEVLTTWRVIPSKLKQQQQQQPIPSSSSNKEEEDLNDSDKDFHEVFCGKDRDVGVLLCEGRDPKTRNMLTIIDRRVAYLSKEEGMTIFGWKEDSIFEGGFVMVMNERHVPSGDDAWNRRTFVISN